ncbi:MAG TPA: hypothetical protein VK469_18390 [Candidatus Kapabacteria bacterium]|nr:hypothetical protein [Candidatus Kapabacteria bacterium]
MTCAGLKLKRRTTIRLKRLLPLQRNRECRVPRKTSKARGKSFLKARKGLGLPAKVSAYQRQSLQQDQPDIYGIPDENGNLKDGIVQYYELATPG